MDHLGQVAGYGLDPSGHVHAYLLTPTPEPTTAALFGLATAGLMIRRWMGRRRSGGLLGV